jgi:plastocyanin
MVMKRYMLVIVLGSMVAACAGEAPPVLSAKSVAPAAQASVASNAQQVTTATTTRTPLMAAGGGAQPTAPQPPVTQAAAVQPTAAPEATPASALPAVPATTNGTIHGTITAMPAGAAKSAVVYLQDGPLAQPVNASIVNKQMNFAPYLSVITVGGKVTFGNNDPFPHNIFTPDHEKWDLGQLDQHGAKAKTFAKAGAYTLLCNLHPNMKAYVLVIGSSYFAKSDGKGNFTIKDVPAGTYKLSAWAPGVQTATQSVTVSGDTAVSFELHR